MQTGIKTDKRLLSILDGGNHFLSVKDPEGLFADASPTMLAIDYNVKKWKLRLVFNYGEGIQLVGTIKDEDFLITEILVDGLRPQEKCPLTPAKTVAEALGDLSRVSGHIKKFLSRNALKQAAPSNMNADCVPFLKNAHDAVFYKTEDTSSESSKNLFRKWRFNYVFSDSSNVTKVEISVSYSTNTGIITAFTDADIYGIGNKKITLTKLLGEDRISVTECFTKEKNKKIPSLKVAFDLDRIIPVLYSPEKKKEKRALFK